MAIETYVIYYLYNWINIYYKYWGAVLYYTASHCVTLHWIYVKSHHSTTLSSITSHTSLHVTYISVYVCVWVCVAGGDYMRWKALGGATAARCHRSSDGLSEGPGAFPCGAWSAGVFETGYTSKMPVLVMLTTDQTLAFI
jgi:hypothetical protein